jgi:NAD(P)-dependent dehydrogenase (short-subunit alcohol dehydrogenase family)
MSKTVLVTGGSQRLGQEIVLCFAKAGWRVWCHYQKSAEKAKNLVDTLIDEGYDARTVQADLSQFSEIDRMLSAVSSESGAIDAIVNNASMFEPDVGTNFLPAHTQAHLDVNLIAPMYLGQVMAAQHTRKAADDVVKPCIVHILDQKVFNLNPDYFSYTLSKLALEQAVALQAQALAPCVRVCAVAPGLMYPSGPQSHENFDHASRVNLLGQPISAEDVAATCLFLVKTSSITGVTVAVDNGQHLVPLKNDVMNVIENYLHFKKAQP